MNTDILKHWAAIPASWIARGLADLMQRDGPALSRIIDRAHGTNWGLSGTDYTIASLAYLYAVAELSRDELDRKLAGAQMQIGRLQKQLEKVKHEPATTTE